MGTDESQFVTTDLNYKCAKGEECSKPAQQNLLLIHGTDDSEYMFTTLHCTIISL